MHFQLDQLLGSSQSRTKCSSESISEWLISIKKRMAHLHQEENGSSQSVTKCSSQSISEWLISIKKRMVYCNFSANDNHCVKHEIEIFYSSVEDGLNVKESNVLSLRTKKVCWLLFYSEQL
ncbi:unnamed protein product [Rotaria socialis]